MKIRWSNEASRDVVRLRDFLRSVAPDAAKRTAQLLIRAPNKLMDYPRIGERLEAYEPREIRRIIVGSYEMRYEIVADTIYIVRVWHCRENRPFIRD